MCQRWVRQEHGTVTYRNLERFQAKWIPVRVKKTRQNKKIEPRSDSIGTEKALTGDRMSKPKGKVALVSGSGRGIGRAIALKLASEGAKVVVNDLDAAPGDAVAAEIRTAGGDAIAVNGSVSE